MDPTNPSIIDINNYSDSHHNLGIHNLDFTACNFFMNPEVMVTVNVNWFVDVLLIPG